VMMKEKKRRKKKERKKERKKEEEAEDKENNRTTTTTNNTHKNKTNKHLKKIKIFCKCVRGLGEVVRDFNTYVCLYKCRIVFVL
jgi:hypothetical protein